MSLMSGLVLLDFGVLGLQQVERQQIPDGYVEIKVSYTGICGSDIHGFTGENGRRFPGQIMGHETEGVIAGQGAGVSSEKFPTGQRVTFNPVVLPEDELGRFQGREQHSPQKFVIGVKSDYSAAFAEYVNVPARNVVPLNPAVKPGVGALVEPLAVAVHAVNRAQVAPGQVVLVCGGGPIGQSIVVALKRRGVRDIIVSEPHPDRRELLERLGASTVDPGSSNKTLADSVIETFGVSAAVGFDAVGISDTLNACLEAVELGGTLCLVGMGSPRLEVDAFAISTAERSVIGSFTYSFTAFLEAAEIASDTTSGLEQLIGQVVSPTEAPDMFTALAAGQGPAGKVLVNFASENQRESEASE